MQEELNTDSELQLVHKELELQLALESEPVSEPEPEPVSVSVSEPEPEQEQDPIVTKTKRGRPRKYEEGAKQHEKDIKYSSQYYREHKDKKIVCEFCKKEIAYIYKHQHYKSRVCQFMRTYKTHKTSENLVEELTKVFIK
jgi:hypothetical protein